MRSILPGALVLAVLGSCAYEPVITEPEPYCANWNDVRHVIWVEYYCCTPDEISYLQECRDRDDCEMFFLLFLARCAAVAFHDVLETYDQNGGSLHATATSYHVTEDQLVSVELSPEIDCPPPYDSWYRGFRNGRARPLTNEECTALIDLRIGADYFGFPPARYFSAYRGAGSGRHPHPFRAMAVRDYRSAGRGGRDSIREAVVRQTRPWEVRDLVDVPLHLGHRRARSSHPKETAPPRPTSDGIGTISRNRRSSPVLPSSRTASPGWQDSSRRAATWSAGSRVTSSANPTAPSTRPRPSRRVSPSVRRAPAPRTSVARSSAPRASASRASKKKTTPSSPSSRSRKRSANGKRR